MSVELATSCPHCGRENEALKGEPGKTPSTGDPAICWGCAGIGVFTDEGTLRLPTFYEAAAFRSSEQIQQAVAAVRAAGTPDEAESVIWGSS